MILYVQFSLGEDECLSADRTGRHERRRGCIAAGVGVNVRIDGYCRRAESITASGTGFGRRASPVAEFDGKPGHFEGGERSCEMSGV